MSKQLKLAAGVLAVSFAILSPGLLKADDVIEKAGVGVGVTVGNMWVLPAKLISMSMGAVSGALSFVVTGGNADLTKQIWRDTSQGPYMVTPDVARMGVGPVIVTTAVNPTEGVHVTARSLRGEPLLSYFAPMPFTPPAPAVRPVPPAVLPSARVAAMDLTGDGLDELLFSNGPGADPAQDSFSRENFGSARARVDPTRNRQKI